MDCSICDATLETEGRPRRCPQCGARYHTTASLALDPDWVRGEIERLALERDNLMHHCNKWVDENKQLRGLLARWITDADAGNIDGVDVALMVESEEAADAAGGEVDA